jgi:hypothetical protein
MYLACLGKSHVPSLPKIYECLAEIRPDAMSQSNEQYKTKKKKKTGEIMGTIVVFCVVFCPTFYLHPRLSTSRILWPAKALYVLYNAHFLLVTVSRVRGNICKGKSLTVSK